MLKAMNPSVLLAAKWTPSNGEVPSIGDHDQVLSASGFFLGSLRERSPSLAISSASWLTSLLDIAPDAGYGTSGGITWSWKTQPHPQFVILYGEDGKTEPAIVTFLGIFLMPSVLSSLKAALSSLMHWRTSVSGQDETTDHLPLENLLLPLACVVVFKINLLTTVYRTVQLCDRRPTVGGQILVTATPFASYCPEVFFNSVMSGCVSKLLGPSGSVFLIDASTVPGCEGGMIVHDQCTRTLMPRTRVCGMILTSLTSEQGQQTGLSLACSSSAISEALQEISSSIDNLTSEGFVYHPLECGELEKLIVLVTSRASWGTGILVTPSLVLTCNHVITNGQDIQVHNTITSETTPASVCFSSSVPDLAVLNLHRPILEELLLKSDVEQLVKESKPRITLSKKSELCKGIEVVVIGFGLRHTPSTMNGPLISRGIVSKVVYDQGQPVLFVTTAAVNPGMSGGLVASLSTRQMLGMVVSNSQSGENRTLYPKLNYCLPFSWVLPALASYAEGGNLLQMHRLAEWGQKVKHLWQLQSNLDLHPLMNTIITSKL